MSRSARRRSYARHVGRPIDQDGDLSGVTELRIHGVGGTTPESMLFDPFPERVAGDDTAGFYRTDDVSGRHVEAYSWGGLTSREASRALWLLLLPFALMNVAGWTQRFPAPTPSGQEDPRRTPVGRLIMVLSVTLTVLVAAEVALVTIDLLANQCGALDACVGSRWWLAPLKAGPVSGHPGRRVALGILAAGLLMIALAGLAKRSRNKYEATKVPESALDGPHRPVLARATTWSGSERVLRLGRFHLAAAFATVAAMGATAAADLAEATGRSATPGRAVVILAAATVVVTLVAMALDRRTWGRPLQWVAALTLALAVVEAARLPGASGSIPGLAIRRGPELIFGVQLALLLVLGLVIFLSRGAGGGREATPQAFRWATPLVLASLAIFMTGSVFAGIVVRLADVLGEPVADARGQPTPSRSSTPPRSTGPRWPLPSPSSCSSSRR